MQEYTFVPQKASVETMKKSQVYTGVVVDVKQYNSQEEYTVYGRGNVITYLPMQAVPFIENGYTQWGVSKSQNISLSAYKKTGIFMMKEGEHYKETEQGLMQKLKSGECRKLSNIRFKISRIVDCYYNEEDSERKLYCSVSCEKWNKTREIIVSQEKYPEFFDIVRRKFPDVFIMPNNKSGMIEYLSEVYAEAEKNCKPEVEIVSRGWFELGGKVIFAKGSDPLYKTAPIPDIENLNVSERKEIYRKGVEFLKIGNQCSEISVMFLFSHLGFSNYWLEKGGLPCRFCLYLVGPSGSLKTSTANVIANVFETDISKKNLRFTSSDASVKNILFSMKDTTILIDDFSSTENETKRHSTMVMENIIRMVGDGILPSKMGSGHTVQRKLRAAIMMTGEDEAGLAESSVLRCVNISIQKDTFSGEILASFQRNNVLKLYFSMYVKFLEEKGDDIAIIIDECVFNFRKSSTYENMAPRLRDAAIVFEVQIVLLQEFAQWIGIRDSEYTVTLKKLLEGMQNIVFQNAEAHKILPLEDLFLIGLFQSMGAYVGTSLAENEDRYSGSENLFMGFEENENGYLWIDFDKAYKTIKVYWRDQGKPFLKSSKKVKECLAEAGLIIYKKNETGTEYLLKSKRGKRKRMLVLIKSVVEKFLDTMKL